MRSLILALLCSACNPYAEPQASNDAVARTFHNASSVSIGRCSRVDPASPSEVPVEAREANLDVSYFAVCTFSVEHVLKGTPPESLKILIASSSENAESASLMDEYANVSGKEYFEGNFGPSICLTPFGGVHSTNCQRYLPIAFTSVEYVYFEGVQDKAFFLYPLDEMRQNYMSTCLSELAAGATTCK